MRLLILLVLAVAIAYVAGGFLRNLVGQARSNPRVSRYLALQLGLWSAAIVSLSQCLAVYRRVVGEVANPHPVLNWLWGGGCAAVLVFSFLVIGFFMYREDRRKGIVKRKLGLYERFLQPGDGSLAE